MKVLHLSTSDINGGAARGAYWLNQALLNAGINSQMLVAQKTSDHPGVLGSATTGRKAINYLFDQLDKAPLYLYPNRVNYQFSPAWLSCRINSKISQANPDIINLHWVNHGYIKPESLASFRKPIVWTLRDLWVFTGGCHYPENCTKYIEKCGSCPSLNSESERDISRRLWNRKLKSWRNVDMTVVAISTWLAERAKESSLLKDRRIEVISNALDESKFKPISKPIARDILGLPQDKDLILFGALQATSDKRKGFDLLTKALKKLNLNDFNTSPELVVFGSSEPKEPINFGLNARYMGKIHDDTTLALLYSSANVTVVPSIQEAFGKTAMESLACGTPVVAFESTGVQDIVDHKQNGYLAEYLSSDDLANGIAWVLEDRTRYIKLSDLARKKVEQKFTLRGQASAYLNLYNELLEKSCS